MIKRVAVCDECGVEAVLRSDMDRAADGWFQVTHIFGRPLVMSDPVTRNRIFCELSCLDQYIGHWQEREKARPAD